MLVSDIGLNIHFCITMYYSKSTMRVLSSNTLIICVTILCVLFPAIETVPTDRYMPPSWNNMCQAEVTRLILSKNKMAPNTLSGGISPTGPNSNSLRNPFLTPEQQFRNQIDSIGKTTSSPNQKNTKSINNDPLMAITKKNNITCRIPKSESSHWKLMDLHEWQMDNNINAMTTPANRTVVFIISIDCETGANISLPWPMKSKGLHEIHVRNCGLVDQFSLANNPLVKLIPDELQVLEIRDSFWLVDLNSKNSILEGSTTDFINIDSDYDCGQDESLRVYISSNVTFTSHATFDSLGSIETDDRNVTNNTMTSYERTTKRPIKPEDRLITNQQHLISDQHGINLDKFANFDDVIYTGNDTDKNSTITNLTAKQDFFELLKKIKNTRIQCDFVKLLVRDESMSSDTPRHLLQVSTQEATHPVLELLNYSKVGMTEFPRELSQWRLYFPRLRYLDLSYNHISQLKVEDYPLMPGTPRTIINIRHNNLTEISLEILKSWASVDNFHVDFRDNPISCDCDMKSMIPFLQGASTFTGRMKQYEYVKDLHCHLPSSLKGRQLKSLDVDDLPCHTFESSNGLIIALAVLLGTFVILTIILIKFKVEIRILLYTRLHVRLPCDSDAQRNHKLYDAFVSYSNEDSDWVIQNLVNYLEKDTSPSTKNYEDKNSNYSTVWNNSYTINTQNNKNSASDHKAFKLCLHQRDFIPGKTIVDNIVDSIEASRHTIIVLSPSFMRSHWAMEELRQAYRQSLVEKTRHLIVLLLDKVPDDDMDPLIKRCVKTFTYLQVNDAIFRDKLVFSLSTKDRATRRRDKLTSKNGASGCISNGTKPNNNISISPTHENLAYIPDTPTPSNDYTNQVAAEAGYEPIPFIRK